MAPARVIGEWRSLVAHLLWEQRVAGSNPVSPTIDATSRRSVAELADIRQALLQPRRHEIEESAEFQWLLRALAIN